MLKDLLVRTSAMVGRTLINGSAKTYISQKPLLLETRYLAQLSVSSKRFLSDRRYSEKHEWVLLDPSDKTIGTVGISTYAQEALGDVVYVQMPEIDSEYNQDDEIGAVESVKAANELYTPVSGKIVDVNKALDEKPGLINSSCYEEGWIFKIKIKDQKEVDNLMDETSYGEYLKSVH